MRILIKNPLLVATMNDGREEFRGGHILIEDNRIVSLGPEPLNAEADQILDATGMVIVPGFVNTHHHLFQSLTRNIPLMQNQSLFDWLKNHYEVWRELRAESVFISAQVGLLELMRSGATTSADHLYLFPEKASHDLIDAEIRAAQQVGIRFQPTRGSMSLGESSGGLPPDDVVQSESDILADTERLVVEYHDPVPGAMVRISLAPCSPFSVTERLLRATAAFARDRNLQLHTHLAETLYEENFCLRQVGLRPVAYLDSLEWLTDHTWVAHAVHLQDDEIKRLAETGTGVSHCPSSNQRLGSGIARVKEMLEQGVRVGLGVDGSASNDSGNMLAEIRQALLLSRLREQPCWLDAREVLWMATRGGAAVLGRDDIGELAVGKQADLALFSVQGLEYAGSLSDPLAALVFTVRTSPVDHLIISGKLQIQAGVPKVNLDELIQQQNRMSDEMLTRAARQTGLNFWSTQQD
jgi:cytosine/adenosine deaminase-related metal-dependent hydrolase